MRSHVLSWFGTFIFRPHIRPNPAHKKKESQIYFFSFILLKPIIRLLLLIFYPSLLHKKHQLLDRKQKHLFIADS
jgi:hypothetical protein